MASAHIEIGTAPRLGAKLRALVDTFIALRANVNDMKAVYDQLALGGDFVSIGAALGLTGQTAAADAETIYNLVGSVQTELADDAFTAQLLSRLG